MPGSRQGCQALAARGATLLILGPAPRRPRRARCARCAARCARRCTAPPSHAPPAATSTTRPSLSGCWRCATRRRPCWALPTLQEVSMASKVRLCAAAWGARRGGGAGQPGRARSSCGARRAGGGGTRCASRPRPRPPSPRRTHPHPPTRPAPHQMATLERAEELLEQLRGASIDGAQRDLQDIKDHAAEQGFQGELSACAAVRRAGLGAAAAAAGRHWAGLGPRACPSHPPTMPSRFLAARPHHPPCRTATTHLLCACPAVGCVLLGGAAEGGQVCAGGGAAAPLLCAAQRARGALSLCEGARGAATARTGQPAAAGTAGARPLSIGVQPASTNNHLPSTHPRACLAWPSACLVLTLSPPTARCLCGTTDVRFFCVKKVGGQGKGGRAPDQWGPLVPPTSTPLVLCAGRGWPPTHCPPPTSSPCTSHLPHAPQGGAPKAYFYLDPYSPPCREARRRLVRAARLLRCVCYVGRPPALRMRMLASARR